MNFIIAAEAAGNTMTGLEKLGLGGRTLLIGLVMVFVVLGIIIGLVSLNKVLLPKIEKGYIELGEKMKAKKAKRKAARAAKKAGVAIEEAPKAKALPAATPAPVAQPMAVSNDEEVVAAITAALSLYYEQQMVSTGKTVKFRVRSIKEIR